MSSFPDTRRDDTADVLHGRRIADPYRWLEDPDSADTNDWVRRQNAATDAHLANLADRDWFHTTMSAIVNRPRAGVPRKIGRHYFVSRNDGTQNQDVWYVAESLSELLDGGRVIVDPNTFSTDGTDSLSSFSVSDDGHYFTYTLSEGGSDWQTFVLLDLATGAPVGDARIQTRFSTPTWLPDCRSYLYVDHHHDGHGDGTQTDAVAGRALRLHRVGQRQADDETIAEFPDQPRLMFAPEVSDDDRYVMLTLVEGTENRNRLWAYRIRDDYGTSRLSAPLKIIDEPSAEFGFVRSLGNTLILHTDLTAARGRVVSVGLDEFEASGELTMTELIAEGEHTLMAVAAAGETLITVALADAQPIISRFALDGTPRGRLDIRGGALMELNTHAEDPEGFVGMSSITSPIESYRFDATTGAISALPTLVRGEGSPYVPPTVRIQRRAAISQDGTVVPYFLITRADLDLSQPQPTLLYGYGGFKIAVLADYRAGWSAWLEAGGVLAIANLRGGGEFGTTWYDDGRRSAKQHVFDDFIGVAEHLKDSGITTTPQLALHGRSNGGLLVGAVLTQRPDLAAAAIPMVGVLDLLRFHRFTIGAAWISDYGDPDDPTQFADALSYSPLHNVRIGEHYPATLVMTGDHDDRVVPLHSHKFTAALQHAQSGEAPVLTRIEVATGHGMGKPASMLAAEWADLLAFAAHHTGLRPRD